MEIASSVLMVRPARFGYDPETAATNAFQHSPALDPAVVALAEFDAAVAKLREFVNVVVVDEPEEDPQPDSIFPNNWFSTFPDGRICLYPMLSSRRQAEVRPSLLLTKLDDYAVTKVFDMRVGSVGALEGTGSLVLDHAHRAAFACLSPRTTPAMVEAWCRRFSYEPVIFEAVDEHGMPIYHTNVVLSICPHFVVAEEHLWARPSLRERLGKAGRTVMPVTAAQTKMFCANVLALRGRSGRPVLVLSTTAWKSFDEGQKNRLNLSFNSHIRVDIPTIEDVGGGGIRCMMAELYLPGKLPL